MKRVNLKKSILVVLMVMMVSLLSLTSYASEEVKETKVTVSEQEERQDSEERSIQEIEKEMKSGIVGIGDTEEEEEEKKPSIFDFKLEDKETVDEKLEESEIGTNLVEVFKGIGKTILYVIIGGIAILIALIVLIVALVKNAKKPKKQKVEKVKPVKEAKTTQEKVAQKVEEPQTEVPYQQEQYEVYAKEDNEKFDKEFEKAEASAYKTLEANGYELPNDEDDDFDMNTVGTVTPIETEPEILTSPVEEDESELTPEDKLNKFVKRIETKREVQQKLFDEALPNANKKEKIETEDVVIAPVVEEKEESLLGFDYEEEKEEVVEPVEEKKEEVIEPVEEKKEESLLGFDYEEEKKEEVVEPKKEEAKIEEPVASAVEEKEAVSFSRPTKTSSSRKTNRFSFVELPEDGAEEKKEETKPSTIGFKRKGTTKKVEEPKEEPKEEPVAPVEEPAAKEEVAETPANPAEEIDFFAEMEANMKKSKEEREKNKK